VRPFSFDHRTCLGLMRDAMIAQDLACAYSN